MADINALYPAPPRQEQSNLLSGDPTKIIGLANALQTYSGRQAIGQAYQKAINPETGEIDTPTLMKEIQSRPDAAWMAGEASQGALARQGQQITNATGQFNLDAAQYQYVTNQLGSLADKKNPTAADVFDVLTKASRATNIPSKRLSDIASNLLSDPKNLSSKLLDLRKQAIGSTGLSGEANLGLTPQGGKKTGTVGQFLETTIGGNGGNAAQGGGIVTGLSPGQTQASTNVGGASGAASVDLRKAADAAPAVKGMLGNLEEDLNNFTAGPAADWTRVGKAWINRNVPLPEGMQFDPKSIASQEQFNKQALQLAQQQFQAIGGTGTDAKFSSAFETNPHETLSQLGNKGVIRLLKGNQDAIVAKNKAWQQYRRVNGPDSYDDFSEQFNADFDPRVFQFKYTPKDERQKYIDRMDKNDRPQFLQNLHYARKQKWTNAD